MFRTISFLLCFTCWVAQGQTIVDLAVETPQLSTLVAVLTDKRYSAVLDLLKGDGPFTVFAPTNKAFKEAGVDVSDVETVSGVLAYHVLSAKVKSTDLKKSQMVPTVQGEDVTVKKNKDGVTVNNANVVLADVMGTNGVVHVIDKVLIPAVDREKKQGQTIVDLAVETPQLSTLVAVLTDKRYSAVLELLQGDGPFTVFAPTNKAFKEAGVDVSDVETVSGVLAYHVLSAKVKSTDLKKSQMVPTVQGEDVTVKKNKDGVTVNNANVVLADVMGTNGVVHVIDKVLIPGKGNDKGGKQKGAQGKKGHSKGKNHSKGKKGHSKGKKDHSKKGRKAKGNKGKK